MKEGSSGSREEGRNKILEEEVSSTAETLLLGMGRSTLLLDAQWVEGREADRWELEVQEDETEGDQEENTSGRQKEELWTP